jgi:hypothetical protein
VKNLKPASKLDVVIHICNPSTMEAETEQATVPHQPGLHSETLFQKITKPNQDKTRISSRIIFHLTPDG